MNQNLAAPRWDDVFNFDADLVLIRLKTTLMLGRTPNLRDTKQRLGRGMKLGWMFLPAIATPILYDMCWDIHERRNATDMDAWKARLARAAMRTDADIVIIPVDVARLLPQEAAPLLMHSLRRTHLVASR